MAMNKTDLIKAVAADAGLTKILAEKAVKATFDAISKELANGGNFTLIGFGTFSINERNARVGKNPQTGASINIAAKKVVKFKPGKALATSVNPVVEPAPAPAKKKATKKK
ncbi:MAG: DNA-binding protein HU [candidate division CPR1 bacterium ADurb.Bin160]|uniref:DNA-binding protein HU n=1 Tax=candidate division CPR1 bacterium ADurb.Bin160 TaxID=1852826 RepID=A0A1V5ZHZ6_9BACT|nr:MAG: DNA-binding protein HU [candidate division CPR1 bacterium ADurb.Bin160]